MEQTTNANDFYVDCLKLLLENRISRNPHYSIRALARDLDIDPTYLLNILNKKRNMTPKNAYKLANHLNLQGESKLNFIEPSLKH